MGVEDDTLGGIVATFTSSLYRSVCKLNGDNDSWLLSTTTSKSVNPEMVCRCDAAACADKA
jgi:hypothetical protein